MSKGVVTASGSDLVYRSRCLALKRTLLCAEARHYVEGPCLTGLPMELPIPQVIFREGAEFARTLKRATEACDGANRRSGEILGE